MRQCGLLRTPKGYEAHEDTKNTISDGIKTVQNIYIHAELNK